MAARNLSLMGQRHHNRLFTVICQIDRQSAAGGPSLVTQI